MTPTGQLGPGHKPGHNQLGAATTSRNKEDSLYLNSLCSARDVGVVEGCPLYYRNDLGLSAAVLFELLCIEDGKLIVLASDLQISLVDCKLNAGLLNLFSISLTGPA